MWVKIRKTFFAGILILAPITISIYILYFLFNFLDGILKETVLNILIKRFGEGSIITAIPGLGILFLLALIFITGTIARNYIGRKILSVGDYIVTHIPILNRIYIAIQEISEAVFSEKRELFKKAVLIEYPRKGCFSIAFFTQDTKGKIQENISEDVVSVIIPTTPNPTSGYLLFVPKKDVQELNMSVEEALKLVISGGSIHMKEKIGLEKLFSPRKKSKRIKPENIHEKK
ncbi:MAG: DUF502 domain-containing protein [bacterium]